MQRVLSAGRTQNRHFSGIAHDRAKFFFSLFIIIVTFYVGLALTAVEKKLKYCTLSTCF